MLRAKIILMRSLQFLKQSTYFCLNMQLDVEPLIASRKAMRKPESTLNHPAMLPARWPFCSQLKSYLVEAEGELSPRIRQTRAPLSHWTCLHARIVPAPFCFRQSAYKRCGRVVSFPLHTSATVCAIPVRICYFHHTFSQACTSNFPKRLQRKSVRSSL